MQISKEAGNCQNCLSPETVKFQKRSKHQKRVKLGRNCHTPETVKHQKRSKHQKRWKTGNGQTPETIKHRQRSNTGTGQIQKNVQTQGTFKRRKRSNTRETVQTSETVIHWMESLELNSVVVRIHLLWTLPYGTRLPHRNSEQEHLRKISPHSTLL